MTIASTTRSAALVLEHAANAGLPEPSQAITYNWSTALHLSFNEVADLAEWARYCETQVSETTRPTGTTHYTFGESEPTTVLDMPVQAWCIVSAKQKAKAAS